MRGFYYYTRTETGKQYPIYCRKKGTLEAPEQVLLDLNEMAKGERFMSVGDWDVTDDGNVLAYTTDNTGFRDYTLHVKDLATGKIFSETVPKVSSIAWAADNKTLFYTADDAAKRPYRLYRHALGADPKSDALVYEEKDEMFRVGVSRSGSRKYLFLASGSHTADEWRMPPGRRAGGTWKMIAPREKEHEYGVDHRGDLLYIRTNSGGCRNFRVVTAPVADPRRENWKELVPCREDVMVSGLDLFADAHGPDGARGRPAADPHHRPRVGPVPPHRLPRAGLLGLPAGQRGVRHLDFPLQLPVVDDAVVASTTTTSRRAGARS